MNLRILTLVLVFGISFDFSANAQLSNFDFSFSSNDGDVLSPGNPAEPFSGTVTGEIIGLQNNASSTPSDIIITSAPSAFDISTPYSFAPFTDGPPTFIVSDGQITAITTFPPVMVDHSGDYELIFGYSSSPNQATLIELEESTGSPFVGLVDSPAEGVELPTGGGLSALNFTPAAVPEPSAWALTLVAVGLLALWHLRVRRTTE